MLVSGFAFRLRIRAARFDRNTWEDVSAKKPDGRALPVPVRQVLAIDDHRQDWKTSAFLNGGLVCFTRKLAAGRRCLNRFVALLPNANSLKGQLLWIAIPGFLSAGGTVRSLDVWLQVVRTLLRRAFPLKRFFVGEEIGQDVVGNDTSLRKQIRDIGGCHF